MSPEGAIYLSIGEPMNTELTDGEILISQGFLNVTVAGTVSTEELLAEDLWAFPNPTTASFILELPDRNVQSLYEYQLIDNMGQLITSQRIESNSEKVDLSTYDSGIYFVKVVKEDTASKTFRIVKI